MFCSQSHRLYLSSPQIQKVHFFIATFTLKFGSSIEKVPLQEFPIMSSYGFICNSIIGFEIFSLYTMLKMILL